MKMKILSQKMFLSFSYHTNHHIKLIKIKKIFCHTTSLCNNHTTVTPQFSCKNTTAFCVIPNCHKTTFFIHLFYFSFCFIFVIRSLPKLWNVIFVNYIIKFHSKRKLISVWNVSWKTALEEFLDLLTLRVNEF